MDVTIRPDWRASHDALHQRDPATLDLDELDELADACFWLCEPRYWLDARRRAYAIRRADGDIEGAVMACWQLFIGHLDLRESALAGSWAARAQEHAAQIPGTAAAGYAALARADWHRFNNRSDEALRHARDAVEIGRDTGVADLVALGRAVEGQALIAVGKVADGIAALDSAMLAAVDGELSRFVTGRVYCILVTSCHDLGDIRRAGEWTTRAVQWCESLGESSWYPGVCRLHRCELDSMRGEWHRAEREARAATDELAPFGHFWTGEGLYLIGEIQRQMGNVAAAEQAYADAYAQGREPLPGLALLRARRGDATGALAMLNRAVNDTGTAPLHAARLLEAHVSIASAAAGRGAAADSARRLAGLAETAAIPFLVALARRAEGTVRIAEGDPGAAIPVLRSACELFRDLSCPYEEAHTRVLLGEASAATGDGSTAELDFAAAVAVFERLGAELDAKWVRERTGTEPAVPGGLSAREVEVLALVARGLSNRDIAASLVISEHTVARHVSNIFRKLDVTSRSAATAFAYEHDLA
jgi:DNA-binding CsgD family transcriptional regulator